MTTDPFDDIDEFRDPELSVEDLLRDLRPAPSLEETAISDLTDEEWDAFSTAIRQ